MEKFSVGDNVRFNTTGEIQFMRSKYLEVMFDGGTVKETRAKDYRLAESMYNQYVLINSHAGWFSSHFCELVDDCLVIE